MNRGFVDRYWLCMYKYRLYVDLIDNDNQMQEAKSLSKYLFGGILAKMKIAYNVYCIWFTDVSKKCDICSYAKEFVT
jgi:hypothetical protein